MPHDKNSKKIDHGDYVIAPAWHRANRNDVFKVLGVNEGSYSCNVNGLAQGVAQVATLSAKDCTVVLKGDGSLPV